MEGVYVASDDAGNRTSQRPIFRITGKQWLVRETRLKVLDDGRRLPNANVTVN
ncbi:hypothetical protein D3C85_1711730 [compost metagenome]